MEFSSDKELEEFIEIATIIKYYKSKEVPVPEEVIAELEVNKDSSEVFSVLYELATNWSCYFRKLIFFFLKDLLFF